MYIFHQIGLFNIALAKKTQTSYLDAIALNPYVFRSTELLYSGIEKSGWGKVSVNSFWNTQKQTRLLLQKYLKAQGGKTLKNERSFFNPKFN